MDKIKQKESNYDEPPKHVVKYFEEKMKLFPSIIRTDYYQLEALKSIMNKNKVAWSDKYFNGNMTIYLNGLIEFNDSDTILFFKKREHETIYKFFFLCKETSTDSIIFYLNQLKKYKTIT